MVFSSSLFIFGFLPLFLILYFLVPEKFRNIVMVLGSFFFCFWAMPTFIFVVIFTLAIDYVLGGMIYRIRLAKDSSKSFLIIRLCVAFDVVMNLGILIYFKYSNFFLDNVNAIFMSTDLNPFVFTRVILPVGISFVIFQKLTYCLDIAKGICKPAKNFFVLLAYILLFPHVIAGPIIKFGELVDQIEQREHTWEKFYWGFQRFAIGLFKKVWIADVLSKYADMAFGAKTLPFDAAWVGAFAYTFQIFFDFSAYSDMAIGLLAIMGFKIGENFNKPYISASITEFWKRWHISLTSWMREYIYFPLGGNRVGKVRAYINLWTVFLISGLWHGASWNYVLWGAYHGGIMCAERAYPTEKNKAPFVLKWTGTLLIIIVGWVFFRATDIPHAFAYLSDMFNFANYYKVINPQDVMVIDARGVFTFIIAAIMCFSPMFIGPYAMVTDFFKYRQKLISVIVFALFCFSLLKIITAQFSPFIYFMF